MIPYNPTTDDGTGFLVSLFKALHHLHNITVATAYDWKITAQQARGELDHVSAHMTEAMKALDEALLGEQAIAYTRDWFDQTQGEVKVKLLELDTAAPEKALPEGKKFRESLKTLEQQGWALLAFLDQDLLGWTEVPDAGRKP